ncbi:MAG: hypothetical protein ACQRW7_03260 [Caulobacterales bacterium]|uniref:hypothetical protein n=1 Tax=Glycocaulis sp. TaxID=1969725 RepID=UPI003FA0E5E6
MRRIPAPETAGLRRAFRARSAYVFPLVLAAIVLIALVTTLASTQVRQGNEQAIAIASRIEADRAFHSAEQTLLYHTLTSPAGRLGIEVGAARDMAGEVIITSDDPDRESLVRANGEALATAREDVFIRFMDQQAFISLSAIEPVYLEPRYDVLSIERDLHRTVYAQIGDFQDEEGLSRIGGAEAEDYPQAGLPPDRVIVSPVEVCVPPVMAELEICQDEGRLLLLTEPRDATHLNALLASPFMMAAMAERGEALGRRVWDESEARPQSFLDLGWPEFDNLVDVFHFPSPPTTHFVALTHDREAQRVRRTAFELTPGTEGRPYVIRSRYRIGGDYVRDALKVPDGETSRRLPEPG